MTTSTNLIKATIKAVWQETPTVKGLQLRLDTLGILSFQPGQWVDFHAPGIQHVGGYSICSTPQELQRAGTFDLCVKISNHPCARWVHQQAAPGDKVEVQVGGTFTLAPTSAERPALFVAGGIGITALSSMIGHLAELEAQNKQGAAQEAAKLHVPLLLYSAATPEEFALLPRLLALQQAGLLQVMLHTTRSHGAIQAMQQLQQSQAQSTPLNKVQQVQGRITRQELHKALMLHGPKEVDAYVCGPPRMTDEVVGLLEELGVPSGCIRTEKWW